MMKQIKKHFLKKTTSFLLFIFAFNTLLMTGFGMKDVEADGTAILWMMYPTAISAVQGRCDFTDTHTWNEGEGWTIEDGHKYWGVDYSRLYNTYPSPQGTYYCMSGRFYDSDITPEHQLENNTQPDYAPDDITILEIWACVVKAGGSYHGGKLTFTTNISLTEGFWMDEPWDDTLHNPSDLNNDTWDDNWNQTYTAGGLEIVAGGGMIAWNITNEHPENRPWTLRDILYNDTDTPPGVGDGFWVGWLPDYNTGDDIRIDYVGIFYRYQWNDYPYDHDDTDDINIDAEMTGITMMLFLFLPAIACNLIIPKYGFVIGISLMLIFTTFLDTTFIPYSLVCFGAVALVLYRGEG